MVLVAFHNDKQIKRKYLARIKRHRESDELVQGVGFESNGAVRGCGVGCTFDAYDHARGPVEIGVPEVLMHLEDAIFEGLPKKDAMEWSTQFLSAIPVGADLSMVWPKFALWLMQDEKHGVMRFAGNDAAVKSAIETVGGLYRDWIETGVKPDQSKWAAAGAAAWAAAWAAAGAAAGDAAWAAARAAARDAARDAARAAARDAARDAAWDAAWDAAGAAARAAARRVHWRACRDELLRLLKSAPLTAGPMR